MNTSIPLIAPTQRGAASSARLRVNDGVGGFTPSSRSAQQGVTLLRRFAQQGFTLLRRSAQQGFTLIELMVVLVIIAIMSATVMLNMADPRGRMVDEVDRFAGRVRLARDSAITTARPMALWISATGYGFEERRAGRWQPLAQGLLVSADWSSGTIARASTPGRARLMFDNVGRADQPLAFVLDRSDRQLPVQIDLDGKVTSGE